MNIYEKLTLAQNEINAPKSQYNNFGKYHYRSCEDIQVAVKPILLEHKLTQIINDEIVNIEGRFYIKATVTLINNEAPEEVIKATAYAREPEIKPKMDESQTTGSASTYARKYALAGLYSLDDNKDSDALNGEDKKDNQKQNNKTTAANNKQNTQKQSNNSQQGNKNQQSNNIKLINNSQKAQLQNLLTQNPVIFKQIATKHGVNDVNTLTEKDAQTMINEITGLLI